MARRILRQLVPARAPAHERELLPEGRLSGPMPWVIAIMLFLTLLAAAAGLTLLRAANDVGQDLAGRVTIQIADPDRASRAQSVDRVVRALADQPDVVRVAPVADAELEAMMREWLGDAGMVAELPIPALIDVDLSSERPGALERLRATVAAVVPDAGVEPHAAWLGAVGRLIRSLAWIAAALMAMMVGATVATVTLATRGALNTHYSTIEILHLIGSTDRQIARLFQRRIAMDATFGCTVGFLSAFIVVSVISWQFRDVGAGLVTAGATARSGIVWEWLWLLVLPLLGVGIATLTARLTITRALHRIL